MWEIVGCQFMLHISCCVSILHEENLKKESFHWDNDNDVSVVEFSQNIAYKHAKFIFNHNQKSCEFVRLLNISNDNFTWNFYFNLIKK